MINYIKKKRWEISTSVINQSYFTGLLQSVLFTYTRKKKSEFPRKIENEYGTHRQGNVLSYEGNICKQIIDALKRRLDEWRTVLLLFKRRTTCEWIFCSQKARRVPQDFHSQPSCPLQVLFSCQSLKRRTKNSQSLLVVHTLIIARSQCKCNLAMIFARQVRIDSNYSNKRYRIQLYFLYIFNMYIMTF